MAYNDRLTALAAQMPQTQPQKPKSYGGVEKLAQRMMPTPSGGAGLPPTPMPPVSAPPSSSPPVNWLSGSSSGAPAATMNGITNPGATAPSPPPAPPPPPHAGMAAPGPVTPLDLSARTGFQNDPAALADIAMYQPYIAAGLSPSYAYNTQTSGLDPAVAASLGFQVMNPVGAAPGLASAPYYVGPLGQANPGAFSK